MHHLSYLQDILVLLGASLFIVVCMNKLRLSPVLGYLIVGAAVGSHGLNIIDESTQTNSIAQFGIVFLLFVIGLELTIERLIRMRLHVFGFGSLQVLFTTLILSQLIHRYCGLTMPISILLSAAVAMSSTAIVLSVLNESKRQTTQVGRLAFSVLLMQDLTVVPLLAIMPILNEHSSDSELLVAAGHAGVKAIIAIIVITIAGRLFLKPFFSLIGSIKRDEIYVTAALLIVLGVSSITSALGLSDAMGAFLAGLLIAETEYRNKIEESIMPFQGLFLSLFFLTVGMSIDKNFIFDNFQTICLYSVVLIAVKGGVIFTLSKIFRFSNGISINSSLLLCQGGEFAFILFTLAGQKGLLSKDLEQMLFMVVAMTMAITPLLAILGNKLEDKIDNKREVNPNMEFRGVSDLNGHVIISGFGRVGRMVAYMLAQEQIDFVVIDSNASLAKKAKSQGFPVYHGDISQEDILRAVGISRASVIVLSMSDKTAVRKATKLICKEFKKDLRHLHIVARVEDYKQADFIKKVGAAVAVPATIEVGLQMGAAVLQDIGIPEHEIMFIKEKIRKNDYLMSKEIELSNHL